MGNYQHRILTDLDETGFGVKYETDMSIYTPRHWHKALELLLFIKGRVTCNFENGSCHFKRGDIYILNSHEVHETKCTRGTVYLVVHIDPERMCYFHPTFDQYSFSLSFDPEDEGKAMAYEQLRSHLMEILRQTREEEGPAWRLERQARLFAVAALLVKHFSKPLSVEQTRLQRSDMTRLEPVLEYVQLHHAQELTLEGAADTLGLNKAYFCRLFKKNMGVSFLKYVYQVRANAVCRELETTDDPIGEIAERHGFRDPKMLSHYFREIYGCTPSEKRKFFREVTLEDPEGEDE